MKAYPIRVCRIGEPVNSGKLDAPELAREYWSDVIAKQSWFDPEKEQLVVLCLSTRYNVQGFNLVSMGTLNESLAHPREIFRAAVAMGSFGIIVMHNQPSER